MEVDILNDILSRTVSNLFSDKIKHMSYVSEDDGGDKPELSLEEVNPQKIIKNNKNEIINLKNQNQNLNEPQPKKNLIEKLINNNIQKNNSLKQNNINNNIENNQNNQKAENLSPKKWCLTIGKKKYEESLKRLQISEKMIASKTLIAQMNLEQLVNEKARVKQELKKYDEDFYHVFKTKPAKENKEVMKPLYYYYQKIKLEITKKSNNNENNSETIIRNEHHNNQINTQTNNTSNTQSIFPSTITYNESTLMQESTYGNNSTNTNQIHIENNRTNKFSLNTNNNTNTYHINNNKNISVNTVNINTNNNNYNVFHRKANSGGGINNTQKLKKEDFIINKANKKRSLSKEEMNALEQEYFTIKNEQNNLTQMLRNYQNEFQKTNNRKVKWAKDIKPVEKEYNKYKMNKERIKQIKELFGHIETNTNK